MRIYLGYNRTYILNNDARDVLASGHMTKALGGASMSKSLPQRISGIYQIRNTVNGKTYIGSAMNIGSRWSTHRHLLRKNKHHSIYLQREWNKYGEDAFEFSVLEPCSILMLIFREQHYINFVSPEYNIAKVAGSALGRKHSDETRKKMSESQKAQRAKNGNSRVVSDETRKRMSESQLRRFKESTQPRLPHSEETRLKISQAHQGKKLTEEAKQKISQLHKGRTFSDEHKKKIGEANKKRVYSDATKEKLRAAKKKWWQIKIKQSDTEQEKA